MHVFASGGRLARLGVPALCLPLALAAQQRATIRTTISDARTHSPITGVAVSTPEVTAFSDAHGHVTLVVADTATLTVRRVGYHSRTLRASALGASLTLEPDPALLSVVTVQEPKPNALASGTALTVGAVSREQLDASAAPALAEAMKGIEGISVQRPGAWGGKAFVRGLGGERVAVLVDGQRVNRACTSGMDQGLATIDPATVERVEVLSGPGSTLYGSGNVGGVINVVTRRIGAGASRSGEIRAAASSAVPGGSLGASAFARFRRTDLALSADASSYGDYRAPTGTVNQSGLRTLSLDGKFNWEPVATQRLAVQSSAYEGRDIGYPGMTGATIPRESRYDGAVEWGAQLTRGRLDAVSARVFTQRLEHEMSMRMQMTTNAMPMTQVTQASSHSLTSGGRAQLRVLPASGMTLDLGAEAVQWRAEATRQTQLVAMPAPAPTVFHTWPDARILDAGAFGQGEWRATPRITFSAGARVDRVTKRADGWAHDDESIGTGNAGLTVRVGAGLTARSSYGLGYRVPDPTESFGIQLRPDGFVYKGTPDLRTEMAHNGELGLLWDQQLASGLLALSGTLFQNDLRDLIAPVLSPGEFIGGWPVRIYSNVSRARMRGVSSSASMSAPSGNRVSLTAQRLLGDNRIDGTPLALVPPSEATLTTHMVGRGANRKPWIEGSWRVVAGQPRIATASGEKATPGFGTLDLRGGLTWNGVRGTVGVENVLDRAFREHIDPGTILRPGRNVFMRLVRTF